MLELSFNQIMKYMGINLIFKDLNFHVYEGDRVGIVGVNGCGKSTILKLIAGIEPLNIYIGSWSVGYDYGFISKPREASIAYLDQLPDYPADYTVRDVLNSAFEDVIEIEKKMRSLENQMQAVSDEALTQILNQYSRLTEAYEVKGGYEVHEKFSKICTGLNFGESFLQRPFNQLSGGEKTSVVLGKLLIDKPDILLLDEPTNHLDTESIEWLENYLTGYGGIIMMVSHDRYFLDNVATKIIEIEDMKAQTFKGNYSEYVSQKEEQMRIQYEDYKEQQKMLQSMEQKVNKLRDWAYRADNNKFFKRAASIQIKLDKLERIRKPIFERQNMRLDLKSVERSGKETIIAQEVYKQFDDKTIFESANLNMNYGECVGLIGPNGSGKSTFIKMLLGEIEIDRGTLKLGANVKVAYLPQEISFKNDHLTTLEVFRDGIDIPEGKAREYLAKFMFFGKRVYTAVSNLSGGERVRLKLAKLLYDEVNLLILDEPTNHLDIDSIETLEDALNNFDGTLLFISHDRYFINKVSDRIIAIENKQFANYAGNYDAYKEQLQQIKSSAQVDEVEIVSANKPSNKSSNKSSKPIQVQIKTKEKVQNIEHQIQKYEWTLGEIDQKMQVEGSNYLRVASLSEERSVILEKLDKLWNELEEVIVD